MPKTVVGLYDDFSSAQEAVKDLVQNGFARENISLIVNDVRGEYSEALKDVNVNNADSVAAGAGIGAVLGGIGGLLLGIGVFVVPGIGPVLAAGPIITTLGGAGVGAVAGGMVGALTKAGVPKHEADIFSEGVRRGGTLLTVYTEDKTAEQAAVIMNKHNPVDLEQRQSEWRSENWTSFDESAQPQTVEHDRTESQYPIPETGAAGVRSYSDPVSEAYPARTRHKTFEQLESHFKDDCETRYGMLKRGWAFYRDSYRFGFDRSQDERYEGVDWKKFEGELRQDWEALHPDRPWTDHKDAIYEGWRAARD